MRATFVIGWTGQQSETTTTMWLAHEGVRRGHDVVFLDYLDFSLETGARVLGSVRRPHAARRASRARYAAALRAGEVSREERCLGEDDVVFLRNNPADRFGSWIERVGNPGVGFGRLLRAAGVRLVNDPDGMERARDHGYLALRVPELLPRTLVSRDAARIEAFLRELDAPAVLKPHGGYGGHGVFYVRRAQVANVRATIGVLAHEGYVVAQEWLPAARRGDKRVLLWQGRPLELSGGRWSAYRRRSAPRDHRNNVHAGGRRARCGLSVEERACCERIGRYLREDGLALVGLDLVGEHVLEVNVFCPGGIGNMHALYGDNVAARIWADLEREHGET